MRFWVLWLLSTGAACVTTERQRPPLPSYFRDAAGALAAIDRTLIVTAPEGAKIGLIGSGYHCGHHLFLTDMRHGTIHMVNLATGERERAIGAPDAKDGSGRLIRPMAAVADCEHGSVYVIDDRSVIQFEMTTGQQVRRVPKPIEAGPSVEKPILTSTGIVFPGFWRPSPDTFVGRSPNVALEGFAIGYLIPLPLADRIEPMLPVLTPGCRTMSATCLSVSLDAIRGGQDGWVGCQGGGVDVVGVYTPDKTLARTVDVRSPLFVSDGFTTGTTDPIPATIKWHQGNSAVKTCMVFGQYLVTVHFTFEPGQWSPGTAMPPRVLMNIHALDGTPIVSDIGLRDYPVARDGTSLYVMAYQANRATDGGNRLALDVVRVLTDDGKLALPNPGVNSSSSD